MIFYWRRKCLKRKNLLIILFISLCWIVKTLLSNDEILDSEYPHSSQNRQSEYRHSSQNRQSCVHPILTLWHPALKALFKEEPPLKCSNEKNWVYVEKGHLHFDSDSRQLHGDFECKYTPLLRKDDFKAIKGETITGIKSGFKITSDFAFISCLSKSGKKYENIIAGIEKSDEKANTNEFKQESQNLNILMFGFDSVSRMNWLRNLPKSQKYFTEELRGIVLRGYNVVGDGTPQALLPILTGKPEIELPEARRGFPHVKPVDGHPWMWKFAKERGYVTQYGEDNPDIGAFHYRMLGFKKQPTDHYMRHFQLEVEKLKRKNKPHCLGSQSRLNVIFKWIEEFFSTYNKPKFSFLFHDDYSHGSSTELQVADIELLEFLKRLNEKNVFNNTVLILMSDHGARFRALRETIQGKFEERLPFFGFAFPTWFERKYPNHMKNFKLNKDRLSSPFDIHETLKDIIDFRDEPHSSHERGISLFHEIPLSRTCKDAGIDNHWCSCLKWEKVSIDSQNVKLCAEKLTDYINSMTANMRLNCHKLELQKIKSAVEYVPEKNLLKFMNNTDADGRVPDFTDNMISDEKNYQITIITSPNDAIYEGTIQFNEKHNVFSISDRNISRINRYGNQPHCVMEAHPHLRPYCYCKT